jgi:hypothetical protein
MYIIDFGLSQSLTVDVNSVLGGYTMWIWTMLPVFEGTRYLHLQGQHVHTLTLEMKAAHTSSTLTTLPSSI